MKTLICCFSFAALCLGGLLADIVVNEVHYNGEPNTAANEFIELYNTGAAAEDLSGWFFNSGIDYIFPAGTSIAAGGYLVIAERPSSLLSEFGVTALGPYASALSGQGETIELRRADGSVADRVNYQAEFPWPVGAGGTGASMELIHPDLDNDLGGAWRSSARPGVLSALTLIPASASSWSWRRGDTEASSPIEDWRQTGFVEDGSWTSATFPLGYGGIGNPGITFGTTITNMRNAHTGVFLRNTFTIAAGEVPPELELRYAIDDGLVVWINGVEVARSKVADANPTVATLASGSGQENVWLTEIISGAPGFLVEGVNTIAVQAFNTSLGSSDFGVDVELIRPQSGADAPPAPTPGARNSVFSGDAAPFIRQVDHSPNQPSATESAVISAKVTDPDGVASVTLEYQVVAPGAYVPAYLAKPTASLLSNPNGARDPNPAYFDAANWTQVAMVDDGSGRFSASIPAQDNRTLVRYRIVVADVPGAAVTVPYADDPSLNFAYFVYNGIPDYVAETRSIHGAGHVYPAATIESVPVYQIIVDSSDFDQAVGYNGGDQIGRSNYDARSAYNWSGTFVYDNKVYDNIGYRLRQRNARYAGSGKRSFKFRFNRGRYVQFHDTDGNAYSEKWKFLATHKMRGSRGNYTWGMEQATNHVLWNITGTPAPWTHWFNMRVIRGAEEAPAGNNGQFLGDHYGMLLAMEEYDARFLDSHGLEKGNLYKLISGRTDGVSVQRYQQRDAVSDGSDFQNIIFQLRPDKSDAWLNENVNYDSWNRYHAIVDAIRHYDVQPNTGEHLKNRAFYFEPSATNPLGRLWVLPWDSDTSWGNNWNGGNDFCKQAIYGTGDGIATENAQRPEFIKEYRNVVREIRDLIWTEEQISLLLDPMMNRIAPLVDVDRDRWTGGVNGSDSLPAIEPVIADMKKFAFDGGTWTGGDSNTMELIARDSGISGQQGRDAYLDALAADAAIPTTPLITYTGDAGFTQNGLAFETSAFADPQGAGSFGAMEWRIAPFTPIGGGQQSILPAGATWNYLDDGSDQGTAWRAVGFNDGTWSSGALPATFGGISNTTQVTQLETLTAAGERYVTAYFRTTVNVADPALIDHFDFALNVDDGAVVYVNGVEVLRDGFNAGVVVAFDTLANSAGNEGVYDVFEVPPSAFVAGTNVIAVELHQQSIGSSDFGFDMSIDAELSLLPPGSSANLEWNADWESGELASFNTSIAPPSSAVRVGESYRARVRHQDNTGRWSHWSAPLEFTVSAPQISAFLDGLVVSEVMYHPEGPSAAELAADPALTDDDFEWIEIMNVGATALDLSDVRLTKGVDFDFITGAVTSIAPGQRLVVVANEAAFNLRYGHAATPAYVVGVFDKSLSNGGEQVRLSFGAGTVIREFDYEDSSPWPEAPDGEGASLVLIAPDALPDHALPVSWRPSALVGGTPGGSDSVSFSGDPNGDDDGDCVPNLLDYATRGVFTVSVDDAGMFSLEFERNLGADDVLVRIERSSDLLSWTDADADFAPDDEDLLGDGYGRISLEAVNPAAVPNAPLFYRLKVEIR